LREDGGQKAENGANWTFEMMSQMIKNAMGPVHRASTVAASNFLSSGQLEDTRIWRGWRMQTTTNHKGQCSYYIGRYVGCRERHNGGGRGKNSKIDLLVLIVRT